jgi:probable rRNA maturation factor
MIERNRPTLGRRRKVGGDTDAEVYVADEQTEAVDLERWRRLAANVLRAEGVRGGTELSLLFVDATTIAGLNEEFMGSKEPTDVLAFPIDAELVVSSPRNVGPDRAPVDPSDQPMLLGDVVVCPSVAREQAPRHAGTVDDELALLVVHGVLHVLGYDHDDPDEMARMRARELELLEAHHWGHPAPAEFRQEQE